ncbi:PAS domain-containing protein, partial [Streptomyces sp. NPDC006265]|uniref:PAS domain-containing protein n=1 Tax=Streptomyces sp. NPDC006265 TaxID=3156740 RepID=UPI0033B4A4A5
MANVVSQGAQERGMRTLRAEGALKAIAADHESSERLRRVLEQALVFAGASLAAVYAPGEDGELLCLMESAGVPRTLYGLRDSYPRAGRSPAAEAHRRGRPVSLGPAELAEHAQARRVPSRDFSLTALPLPGDGGCLLAVTERPEGFGPDDLRCLELIADAVAFTVPAAPADAGELPPSAFSLAMDTGLVRVGDDLLDLFGLDPVEFDGRVETLLSLTVPEDLPSLMSVVEADHMSIGDRELEFRVLQPAGPPKWLRLRGRILPGGEGRPARLVGTVVDVSTLRSDVTDVARVQRLAAALATAVTVRDVGKAVVAALRRPLRADRIALAELESDRLVVTVLDPPEPEAWPELWRSEWRTEWPDAPVRAMPTLAAALREGRARIWPAGSPLERALAEVGPGGLAVLPLPAGMIVVWVEARADVETASRTTQS